MAKQKSSPLWIVVAFVVAGISWYMKQQEQKAPAPNPTETVDASNPQEAQAQEVAQGGQAHKKAAPSAPKEPVRVEQPKVITPTKANSKRQQILVAKNTGYTLLENCSLVDSYRNDGDSFFVKHADGETEFRLYFVDTPESKYKEYRDGNNNGKRLQQQGQYYGGLDRYQTVAVGSAAKQFVKKVLSGKKFKVITKWDSVYGSERCYAFVVVPFGDKERYLHELLVENGLGRIHTTGSNMPDGRTTSSQQKSRLKNIEKKAKAAKRGGWGM